MKWCVCIFPKRDAQRRQVVNKHVLDGFPSGCIWPWSLQWGYRRGGGYKYTQSAPRSVCRSICVPASAGFCSSMTSASSRALSDLCHGEPSAGRSRQPHEECRRCRRRINMETWEQEGRRVTTRCGGIGNELSESSEDRLVQGPHVREDSI